MQAPPSLGLDTRAMPCTLADREGGASVPGSPHHKSCPSLWRSRLGEGSPGLQGPPRCRASVRSRNKHLGVVEHQLRS